MNIDKLLTSPGGKTLEFKRSTSALKQIMKNIVAFADTPGGIIVLSRPVFFVREALIFPEAPGFFISEYSCNSWLKPLTLNNRETQTNVFR